MVVEGVIAWFIERPIAAYGQIKCDVSEVSLMLEDLNSHTQTTVFHHWIMFFHAQSDWGQGSFKPART